MKIKHSITIWLLFIGILLLEFAFGYYMAVVNNYMVGDAASRVANAYYILFSRDPHLGAIGFIWNPLPSLIEMVILIAKPIFPVLVTHGVAGVLVTSGFAAVTAVVLFRSMKNAGISIGMSITITLLYAFNPYIFLYGSNGMSETMFTFFLIIIVINLMDWINNGKTKNLVIMSIALALAFLIRYEAVVVGAAVTICIIIHIVKTTKRNVRSHISGVLMVFLTPSFFAGFCWLFLNYDIMGDPLHFFKSSYSNLSQTETISADSIFGKMLNNPIQATLYVMSRFVYFMIPIIVLLFFRIKSKKVNRDLIYLSILLSAIPAMHIVMLMNGSSFGFLRFYYYALPILVAWFIYDYKLLKNIIQARVFVYSFAMVLLATAIVLGLVINNPNITKEDYEVLAPSTSESTAAALIAEEIALYVDNLVEDDPDSLILTDAFNAFYIIMKSKYSKNLVITSDRDFKAKLSAPIGTVDYILIPFPEGTAILNAINVQYPELFHQGASWVELVKDFGGEWRLYQIIGSDLNDRGV